MSDLLTPFQPTPDQPWNRVRAAHLLRRTGFAPGESQTQRAIDDGPGLAVDRLIDSGDDSSRHDELNALGERLASRNNIDTLRGWWLQRMCHTVRPLDARMSVFWHDHFATSNAKVQSAPLMLRQHRMFERLGMGKFRDLLKAVSRDPAMIVYLDGNDNVKGRPNENYARELLELFSLGVGNYSEDDVKQAARAFTGWHQKGGRFKLSPRSHDQGEKTFLGSSGQLSGDDIIDIVLKQPACARFMARKLIEEFVTPAPVDELVEEVAGVLSTNDYHIGETTRILCKSRAMFDSAHYRARIKSPVELVIGMARSLEIDVPASLLATATSNMGQRLFEPPSVKGWDGHRTWLNSTTMLVRLNAAVAASEMAAADSGTKRDGLAALLLDGNLSAALRDQLEATDTLQQALELLLTSPEYQMA